MNIPPYFIMSIFTISPIQLSQWMVSHTPYPPPILAKHHTWYSVDANLFISICEILFGLYCAYFCQSHYFQTIIDVAEPKQPMPFTPCLLTILTNFLLHDSSHFSINLAISSAPNKTGKIYTTTASTGIYRNARK